MTVAWLRDPGGFASPEWSKMVEADPDATMFHTPRYLKLYWEELGHGDPAIALVRHGGEDVAASAFELADGTLRFLGGTEVTDYMGPVGRPGDRDAAAKELMTAIAARDDWRRAELGGLPEDGSWLRSLEAGAEASGLRSERFGDGVAPFLALPGSFDDYLASLPSKRRHEIRRKERRLRVRHPDARLVDSTPETMVADLGHFIEMHRSSPGDKGRFMVPGMELFFRRLGESLVPDGTLRLAFLESDGQKLAGALGFRWRDRFLLYNSGYDQAHAEAAPGMVLVAELIRSAVDEGRTGFDMLTGDLGYKYRFGARPRTVARLDLVR